MKKDPLVFSWDTQKAITNYEKHHVSFDEAATIFGDPEALDWPDLKHSHVESRFKRVGISADARVLMVVYTVRRLEDVKETIRIISARQASHKERAFYFG